MESLSSLSAGLVDVFVPLTEIAAAISDLLGLL